MVMKGSSVNAVSLVTTITKMVDLLLVVFLVPVTLMLIIVIPNQGNVIVITILLGIIVKYALLDSMGMPYKGHLMTVNSVPVP
jgi:hypothetical protein